MAFNGLRHGDITIRAIGNDGFDGSWNRLLVPLHGLGFQLGPVSFLHSGSLPEGRMQPMLVVSNEQGAGVPLDVDLSSQADTPASSVPGLRAGETSISGDGPVADIAAPSHFIANGPFDRAPVTAVTFPGDNTPPPSIEKAEALIWSGPAVIAFPGEPHEHVDPVAAFLPLGSSEPTHGLVLGMDYTLPPMPPPDMI